MGRARSGIRIAVVGAAIAAFASFVGCPLTTGNCREEAPTWAGEALVLESLPGQSHQCVVSISRGANAIEFDITPDLDTPQCSRVGANEDDRCTHYMSNGCWELDGGIPWCKKGEAYQAWDLFLGPEDESQLGGLDFVITTSCDGTVLDSSHEQFLTEFCER